MHKLLNFLSYHNAVPIALGILFLGAGGALAASPVAQDAVFSSEIIVQSIDNARIVEADLKLYPFSLQVTAVTEDTEAYYVEYTLQTIELVDGVWQDRVRAATLTVAKDLLGGKDLGLYATEELAELREHERSRLMETQAIEQGIGVSQKVVATVYSGLVGALLDPTTETFPAYEPVIAVVVPATGTGIPLTPAGGGHSQPSAGSPQGGDTEPPALTLVGGNPARIQLDTIYIDEGVIATDNSGQPTVTLEVDGHEVDEIDLDTSRVWAYVIAYTATDASGNKSTITRDVVIDGEAPAPTPTPEPELEPEPEQTPATTTATSTP